MKRGPVSDPCVVVIFGASGDLTRRKLFPALHNLYVQGLIPETTSIVGMSRSQFSDDEFRNRMHDAVGRYSKKDPAAGAWSAFAQAVFYVAGDGTDE